MLVRSSQRKLNDSTADTGRSRYDILRVLRRFFRCVTLNSIGEASDEAARLRHEKASWRGNSFIALASFVVGPMQVAGRLGSEIPIEESGITAASATLRGQSS